jgi:hypothetical protein
VHVNYVDVNNADMNNVNVNSVNMNKNTELVCARAVYFYQIYCLKDNAINQRCIVFQTPDFFSLDYICLSLRIYFLFIDNIHLMLVNKDYC